MIERRNGSRAFETISARREREAREAARRNAPAARRAFWERKAAEAERAEALEAERDAEAVRDWLARFAAARNATCIGSAR